MMDLNALYKYLQGLGASFTLKATDTQLQPELQAFIGTMPGKQITVQPVPNGISLQGSLLTLSATTTDAWPAQGLTNVTLTLSSIIITINGATNPVAFTGIAQALLPFSPSVKVPVNLTALNQDGSPWQITLAQNANNITPMEAILLGNNGSGLPFDIPTGMDFLSAVLTVDKKAFFVNFYPNSKQESFSQFTLTAPAAQWTPVPDIFAFDGLDIIGSIKTNSRAVTLLGHLLINGTGIDVGITMTMGDDWTVFTRPTPPAKTFPGLADLAKWIGGATLGTDVSSGFSSVQVSTNGFDAAIADVTASINIKKFSLNYLNINSLLSIGALKLDVLVQLPNLIIKGGLHDGVGLKIADLLASLNLPTDAVPQNLTLAKADFSADLRNSVYSIDTEVDNLWSVGPLSFDKVTLSLGYNKPDGLTGTFGCQFTIGNTATILVQAGYGGAATGWEFAGGLDPTTTLKIGDVIVMLADQFGISSVPEPIKSLVITELWMSYATGTSAFEFTCAGNFKVDDTEVDMTVVVKLQKGQANDPVQEGQVNGTKGYNAFFSGNITINNLVFDIVFNTSSTSTNVFIASFHNKSTGSISLHDLVAGVSTNMAQFIPTGLEIDLREVKFIFFEQNKAKQFAFGLEVDVAINLNDLPVVGSKLPSGLEVDINNLQILYASKAFTKDQVGIINPLLPSGILPLNAAGVSQGLMIEGELVIAGFTLPINTGNKPAPQTTTTAQFTGTAAPASAGAAPSPITWFNVNKQLGPLSFERIGVEYTNGVLSFALDASLTLGPASLSMMGLSFGSPLNKFEPVFGLQGFAMSLQTPSLELGGAFLKGSTPDGATAYYGQVIAKFGTIGIKVLGGDIPEHQVDDPNDPNKPPQKITIPASFFLYANVNAPLGGPPYLYLNGFAGGFGINNTLKLPTLENLPGYILLPGPTSKAPAQGSSPKDTIAKVLPQMQQYFVPTPGEYWAAAGIAVSSFEMINAFALVTVSFGVDFQIAVLGTCSMSFPTAATSPIAYVEIDLMASYSTATGLLAIEGIISPASFIFISSCQITGGFAFYVWINPPALSDPNAPKRGDFVVTLGGYHPSFTPPKYYPVVPRLGINLSMGPLHVTGGCYFALTPGMFMAGFAWDATFDISIVKVWFKAGADFLIAWAPFHYEADAYVNLGCSVNLGLFTINLSIGADLYIWGPPFGGRADVDLDIISFTISFGAEEEPAKPLGWSDFKTKFLPGDTKATPAPQQRMMRAAMGMDANDDSTTNVIKATAAKGLLATNVDGFNWILDPDHFSISIASNVPANKPQWGKGANDWLDISYNPTDYNILPPPVDPAKWPYLQFSDTVNQMDDKNIWNPVVNIKPMKLNGVASKLQMTLLKADNDGNYTSYITALTLTPTVLASAGALWSEHTSDKVQLNDAQFQKSCLTGFNITPLPRVPMVVNGVKLILLLYQQANRYYFNYQALAVNPNYKVSSTETDTDNVSHLDITVKDNKGNVLATLPNQGYVLNALVDPWVSKQRSAILTNLSSLGFSTSTEVALNNFATQTILTDWPEAMLLADSLVA